MTTAAQHACGGSCLWHWLKLQVPAQAAIAGGAKHIDRQYVPRFTQARQNLSRAIHAAAVVAGSSSPRILRASGASPYDKDRLRPRGWLRLQVAVWPTGARSSNHHMSSTHHMPPTHHTSSTHHMSSSHHTSSTHHMSSTRPINQIQMELKRKSNGAGGSF